MDGTSGNMITALIHKPEFASFLISLVVGLLSLILARGAARASANRRLVVDDRNATVDAGKASHLPSWLGACGGFHLLSTVLYALNLVQAAWLIQLHTTAGIAMPMNLLILLLILCILIGLSALLLANLTERLTIEDPRQVSLRILPASIGLIIIEVVIFALGQPNFCYLVSEGAWLLACILMTSGLLRLQRGTSLNAPARLLALITAVGFFARALIALVFLLNLASTLLLKDSGFNLGSLGGLVGLVLTNLPLLKAICIAWTAAGLMLLALAWRRPSY